MEVSMKKGLYFALAVILMITIFSCVGCGGYIPDWGPRNIKFTPGSGKVGDIVTITGENFFELENMELYKNNRQEFINKFGDINPLVYFNVNLYTEVTDILQLHIEGEECIEYISFDTNKIVCKVPEGAKSGKIWVNGYYAGGGMDLHHPSEEEFIVYDETGDIVR
jgi:hypothetical protein